MKRITLLALCMAVVLTACATPVYVRPYTPSTRAESLAVHADSMAWAADLQAKRNRQMTSSVLYVLAYFLVILPLTAALATR